MVKPACKPRKKRAMTPATAAGAVHKRPGLCRPISTGLDQALGTQLFFLLKISWSAPKVWKLKQTMCPSLNVMTADESMYAVPHAFLLAAAALPRKTRHFHGAPCGKPRIPAASSSSYQRELISLTKEAFHGMRTTRESRIRHWSPPHSHIFEDRCQRHSWIREKPSHPTVSIRDFPQTSPN